jgi:hypothetical protein
MWRTAALVFLPGICSPLPLPPTCLVLTQNCALVNHPEKESGVLEEDAVLGAQH